MDTQTKAPNPKDAAAQDKVPLHVFPMTAILGGSVALFDGLLKYGLANYRAMEVNASVYHGAALRHMFKWYAGEEFDIDMKWDDETGGWVDRGSGLPNLWHALACIAILIDADAAKTLIDDREYPSGFLDMMRTKSSEVIRLRSVHASRNPRHYDRRDAAKGYAPMCVESVQAPVPAAPATCETRDIARRYLIEAGATFYQSILKQYGVTTFSDLPDDALTALAARAPQELSADAAFHELISQG